MKKKQHDRDENEPFGGIDLDLDKKNSTEKYIAPLMVIEDEDAYPFAQKIQTYINKGYLIISTNCASHSYTDNEGVKGYVTVYQALLVSSRNLFLTGIPK